MVVESTPETTPPAPLLSLAVDISASMTMRGRYSRLLEAVRALVPCDAVCLLAVDEAGFTPVATLGLSPDVMGRHFPASQPRLRAIADAPGPLPFPPDSPLADPFDGLLERDPTALARVHACLGCPLRVEGQLVGLLTADALAPGAFDGLSTATLTWISALAAAAVRTARLIEALERTSSQQQLVAADLARTAEQERGGGILGQSAPIVRLREEIAAVAASHLSVLVTGETGVGKELIARAIHAGSPRRDAPLIYLNCAAIPETVVETELFGHVRGAFTGATHTRAGKFEVADKGTLFLDEIGELSLTVQPKLLRALQQGEIQRVGADRPILVDVRVIAATNRDLEREVAAGRFRADLFHRLAVYPIHAPALAERKEDIPMLAGHFCDQARLRLGLGRVTLSRAALDGLTRQEWPGNVRELENWVFRTVVRAAARVPRGEPVVLGAELLGPDGPRLSLPPTATASGPATHATDRAAEPRASTPPPGEPPRPLREEVDDFQRLRIRQALAAHEGNWARAARALGLDRSNLHHLARRLGLRE